MGFLIFFGEASRIVCLPIPRASAKQISFQAASSFSFSIEEFSLSLFSSKDTIVSKLPSFLFHFGKFAQLIHIHKIILQQDIEANRWDIPFAIHIRYFLTSN